MFKYTRQENGYSLILALLVAVLISILGISLLIVTANSLKMSSSERDDQSVFYIAEGGLNKTKSNVEQLVKDTYDDTRVNFNKLPLDKRTPERFKSDFIVQFENDLVTIPSKVNFEEQFNQQPTAEVTITQENIDPLKYKITSNGFIGSKTRTVVQTITINLGSGTSTGSPFSITSAIHAKHNIDLGGGTVNGDVSSDSGNISITNGGTKINGKIGTTPDKFSKPSWMEMSNEIIGNVAFPENILPSFPDSQFTTRPYTNSVEVTIDGKQTQFQLVNNSIKIDGGGNGHINGVQKFSGVLRLTQDMNLKTLAVTADKTLTIDVGNSDKNLYIDNFDFRQGHINILGSGNLNLYIKDSFNFANSSRMNSTGDLGQLSVYYAGTSPMEFAGDSRTNASIHAKSADLKIDGSGSIQGNIYTGGSSVTVAGGSFNHNLYIYAPNAEVTLSGSGKVGGGIMAQTVKTSGNPTVTYQSKSGVEGGTNGGIIFEENNNLTLSSSMLEVE